MNNLPIIDLNRPKQIETATFAMGWFWGPDAQFGITDGVVSTRVGYSGGTKENPSYYDLGDHSEAIQIDYDPNIISYDELLDIFWKNHSPEYKAPLRQYMSIIFYNKEQKKKAYETKMKEEKLSNSKIYTEVLQLVKFFPAENYHQKYYLQLTRELMNEFSGIYPNFNDFINSTAAAHVNGYIKGCGSIGMLKKEIKNLGLSEKSNNRLLEIVKGYGR